MKTEKIDLRFYTVKSQVALMLANDDFKAVFNEANKWEDVVKYLNKNVLMTDPALLRLQKKFNQ
ncbi:MAG: hypothetical protein V4547_16800 [Bacteroidota bacterium]